MVKLSKRAENALIGLYNFQESPAIALLVSFASQSSGLDPRNYYSTYADRDGVKSCQQERASIQKDWENVKRNLSIAAAEKVTDADVIANASRAFSGRLEWKENKWEYCTGQYFPTEYRKAAAAVLYAAVLAVRRARPAQVRCVLTIDELKDLNEVNGGCWFSKDTMRFFKTRIESKIIGGKCFVTSEQHDDDERMYSVRSFDDKGSIDTVGEFHSHATRGDAMKAAREYLKSLQAV